MIAALALLFALQVTPELRHHVEAGPKAKAAGDLDTATREFCRAWSSWRPGLPPRTSISAQRTTWRWTG
jgi:hypothetical protein